MVPDKFLRLPQVIERTGLKRTQIYLYMKKEMFPKSVKIGLSSVAWLESEVNQWIKDRSEHR